MLQLYSHNRFPDCLRLDLTTQPLETDSSRSQLYCSLKFDQQWQSLGQGRIKFGLKGGQLHLDCEGNTIPLSDRRSHHQVTLVSAKNQASPTLMVRSDAAAKPTWIFSLQGSQPLLQGDLEPLPLATLKHPDRFEAGFGVRSHQVMLTDAENLWKYDISPNQHAILERLVVFALMQHYFAQPLSRVTSSPTPPPDDSTPPTADFTQLQKQIDQISQAKNASFLELAAAANLDPKTDFAGGNLRGIIVDEINLSGANLSLANCRGAELCDGDLSEANLYSTNLRGADLSGAYLENANLSYSDLQRASLALANLADADLRGANLQGANLSQANLSHAQVEGAQFADNVGVTDSLKASLQERGASFS